MVYLGITIGILTFFLLILGMIDLLKFGIKGKRKKTIMCIIGALILLLSVYIVIDNRRTEEKFTKYKLSVNYETQINRLLSKKLPDSYIEELGNNPLFKQTYIEGQEYERIGNFKKAIECYNEIFKYRLSSNVDKVSAYNLIGSCYFNLYELEKSMQSFKKAIEIVEKIKDKKYKSNGKATTFYYIGCVYKELMQWENALKYLEYSLNENIKLDNNLNEANTLLEIFTIYFQLNNPEVAIKKLYQAIQAYQAYLKAYISDDLSIDYAMNQNNLGNAYHALAETDKDKVVNSERAIQIYREALKVCPLDDFPMYYAIIQNNLGNTYRTLAEVKDKAVNCERAIQTCQEALKVYTLDDFPMYYAMANNNLGTAYCTLAEVKDTVINCEKAIQYFQEALKVYTLDDLPMQHAITQYNLGNAYYILAVVKDKVENSKLAVKAYQKALKVYTKNKFPEKYRIIEENIQKCL